MHRLLPLLLLIPSLALADRLPRSQQHDLGELPVRVVVSELVLDVVFEPEPLVLSVGEDSGATPEVGMLAGRETETRAIEALPEALGPAGTSRPGAPPWPLLGEHVDHTGCRSAAVSADAHTVVAICALRGVAGEHAFIRQGDALMRYPQPVAPAQGLSLSADGMRLALVAQAGSAGALQLLDLSARTVYALGGGFREPTTPFLAAKEPVVAFVAKVGGKPNVLLVSLGETRGEDSAKRLWQDGGDPAVHGIDEDGRRVLITARTIDLTQAILLGATKGLRWELSGRKGDVAFAALHPSGESALFSSSIGGACGIFWLDLVRKVRTDFLGSVEHCYGRVGLDEARRPVAHEGVRGKARRGFVWDRKKDEARLILPLGCSTPVLSSDGLWVAASCGGPEPGTGTWLFGVPPEEGK